MFKRALLSIVASLFVAWPCAAQVVGAFAQGPTTIGQVASGMNYIPNTISALNTSAIMTRKCGFARDNISSLQAVYAGFATIPTGNNFLGGEISPGNAITYNGWVEYPTGNPVGTTVQFKCSASNTCSAPNGGMITTDVASINIPKGSKFCVWTYEPSSQFIVYDTGWTKTNGLLWETSCGNNCEATALNTSGVPSSPGSITDNQSGKVAVTPVALIAPTGVKSVYLLGDSRTAGIHDTADTTSDLGNLARSLGPTFPYINGGVASLRDSAWYFNHTNQLTLAKYTNVVVDELSINEFIQFTAPVANVLNYKYKMAHLFEANNMPYIWTTIEPVTTTSDGCITTVNQSQPSYSADRVTFNDTLRGGGLGVGSYYEIANPVEANNLGIITQDGTYWYVTTQYSDDCIHEIAAGNAAIVSSGNVSAAIINSAAVPTTSQPSADLTMVSATYDTTTPKFGSAALSGGYGSTTGGIVPGSPPYTIGAWAKYSGTPTAADHWIVSIGPLSLGVTGANCFLAIRTGSGAKTTSTDTSICDGNWHWVAATAVATSSTVTTITMYVDGVTPGGGTATPNVTSGNYNASRFPFAIRTLSSSLGTVQWPGEVDDAAIFTGTVTGVPSGAFTGTEANLIVAFGLNSNGTAVPGPNF